MTYRGRTPWLPSPHWGAQTRHIARADRSSPTTRNQCCATLHPRKVRSSRVRLESSFVKDCLRHTPLCVPDTQSSLSGKTRGMQEAASHACGHEVQVKGELIWCDAAEDASAPIWALISTLNMYLIDTDRTTSVTRAPRPRSRPPCSSCGSPPRCCHLQTCSFALTVPRQALTFLTP